MAFAGLKKQINKANQYVTKKMGSAEGTRLDDDFMEMERKTDVTVELVEELQVKTKEFLQPNPTARAKMAAPEGEGNSVFAKALVEFGEALRQMADLLHHLQMKDLKEVMHHRKKLQGRRLDFDCKRRQKAKYDEIRGAGEKFEESLHLTQMGMFNLLENYTEQVSQLCTFAEALYEFHSQCSYILRGLQETLAKKREEAESRPKPEFVPKSLLDLNLDGMGNDTESSGTPSPIRLPAK
ncbi:hypothetical protein FF38_13386 [Lucilia cuprina]|uniref:BAR domain-containing protein n=1 Tax=Lucilia cuprina TaxID=7375 RepID=A0A0L0CK52_LUCCU|nr:hypothetical protein FF38_13386 [Lucilia cuprina]